jgi:hypothetical protein
MVGSVLFGLYGLGVASALIVSGRYAAQDAIQAGWSRRKATATVVFLIIAWPVGYVVWRRARAGLADRAEYPPPLWILGSFAPAVDRYRLHRRHRARPR